MTSVDQKTTSEDWRTRLEGLASDRCDLDVLLKDGWRHKIVARDEVDAQHPSARRSLRIDGADHTALQGLLATGHTIEAFALTALHSVLDAYGHGDRTVVALVDTAGSGSILPTVVDHTSQLDLDCRSAISRLQDQLADPAAELAELTGRGLFDAALLVSDDEPSALPAFPLLNQLRRGEDHLEWTLSYPGELFDDEIIAGVLDVVRVVFGQLVR